MLTLEPVLLMMLVVPPDGVSSFDAAVFELSTGVVKPGVPLPVLVPVSVPASEPVESVYVTDDVGVEAPVELGGVIAE